MADNLYFLNRKSESIVEKDRNLDFDVLSYDKYEFRVGWQISEEFSVSMFKVENQSQYRHFLVDREFEHFMLGIF
jgi:hypothetical protein